MTKSFDDGDYVLGTQDDEIRRLGLQHAVWRPRATDAWRRAGFAPGHHLLDIGCGPGYATMDLSDVVGPTGRVTGLERSPRFLKHLEARLATEPQRNVDLIEIDLDSPEFPSLSADGAWCRWVFAFVTRPRELLRNIRRSLKPGSALVIHEYFDYRTFKLVPREPDFDEFVKAVMASWRASGGEPDVAVDLLSWLPAESFRIVDARPLIDVASRADFTWQWPATFLETGLERLLDLGFLTSDKAARVRQAFQRAADNPQSLLVTPGLLEIVALAT